MSAAKWQVVQELIQDGEVDEAIAILKKIDDPKAVALLKQLQQKRPDNSVWLMLAIGSMATMTAVVLLVVVVVAGQRAPQMLQMPTQIALPSVTYTTTATETPFRTWTPRPTLTPYPTATDTITSSPTAAPTMTISDTPTYTVTGQAVDSASSVDSTGLTPLPPEVFYLRHTSNLRECPDIACSVVVQLNVGQALGVDAITTGTIVNNDNGWYRTSYRGRFVYVHRSLVSRSAPQPTAIISQPVQPMNPVYSAPAQAPTAIVIPVGSGGSGSSAGGNPGNFTCDCSLSCGQILSCQEAYYQLNTCGCSARDSDKDGVPCESLCNP